MSSLRAIGTYLSKLVKRKENIVLLRRQLHNYCNIETRIWCMKRPLILHRNMTSLPNYSDIHIHKLAEFQKSSDATIIDVREVHEIRETGVLPGAINIPLKEIEQALNKSPEEFKTFYSRPKPEVDSPIVLSCRSGKRSTEAAFRVASLGYTNVFNFTGGWLEWEKHLKKMSPLDVLLLQCKNGYVKRIRDEEIRDKIIEVMGSIEGVFIMSPPLIKDTLAIRCPHLVVLLKNMQRPFLFQIQILDDANMKHLYKLDTSASHCKVRPFSTIIPLSLKTGWNLIHVNLTELTQRAYGTNYVETQRLQVHAACRLRRIYFMDRPYSEDILPDDFKLYK